MKFNTLLFTSFLFFSSTSHAGFADWLNDFIGGGSANQQQSQPNNSGSSSGSATDALAGALLSTLSEEEAVKGLKEALAQGVNKSIRTLGTTDGFWTNDLVKIALPPEVQKLSETVSRFGGDALVQNFHQTINRAAEAAVPHVADTFSDSIRAMSIQDAIGLVKGGDQAATNFFRRTTSDKLNGLILPVIKQSTDQAGLTSQYKKLTQSLGPLMQILVPQELDLDQYVTQKTLDGLFTTIGNEEAKIRANPKDQGKAILERVFGAI